MTTENSNGGGSQQSGPLVRQHQQQPPSPFGLSGFGWLNFWFGCFRGCAGGLIQACSDASAYVYAFPLLYLSVLDSYCLSHNAIVHIALTPTHTIQIWLQNNNTISLIIFPNYHLYNPYLMSAWPSRFTNKSKKDAMCVQLHQLKQHIRKEDSNFINEKERRSTNDQTDQRDYHPG